MGKITIECFPKINPRDFYAFLTNTCIFLFNGLNNPHFMLLFFNWAVLKPL